MIISILGAHNVASATTGFTSVLIDGVIAVDAGSLAAGLTFRAMKKLKAVLLTHRHYDHMRDIPALGMVLYLTKRSVDVYGAEPVREAIFTYLLNDQFYMDFTRRPAEKPTMRFHTVTPGEKVAVDGYEILPVSVAHSVPATGYQVTGPDGKKAFVTSDTGPGLAETWKQISPDMLVTELTTVNKEGEFAQKAGHLTPALLQQELDSFKSIHHYLPRVVLMHVNPFQEKQIKAELLKVEKALKIKITLACEGMRMRV